MNKAKVLEFFDASKVPCSVHVVGCGAIGSHVCEQLSRLGFINVDLYDFDKVEAHNITNQLFTQEQIGMAKVDACAEMMKAINPEMQVTIHPTGVTQDEILNGVIILCVDNIELRKKLVEANKYNPNCVCFMDYRMRLTDAQHYFAERANTARVKELLQTMNFTHEEAIDATPKSACGYELSVIYTVKMIVSAGMANLVKYFNDGEVKKMILIDTNMFTLDAF